MKKKKTVKIVVLAAVAVVVGAMFIYLLTGNHAPTDTALAALASGDGVTVSDTGKAIIFTPEENSESNALVFYPGGKVDAEAYAPFARDVAEQGILCVIVKMPFDLAVFNIDGAKEVIDSHPEIKNWYVSGHSLGGVMAAEYAAKDDRVQGIAFLASYPNSNLSGSGKRALSITAEHDGVLDRAKYEQALVNFPDDTILFDIKGGNHGGFGSYGAQDGDKAATILPEEQQNIAAKQIAEWILDAER